MQKKKIKERIIEDKVRKENQLPFINWFKKIKQKER